MQVRQLLQAFVALFRQLHLYPPPVAAADAAPDETRRLASRNERHHSVMLGLQAFGQFSDGCPFAPGKSLDLEQQQVLQRGYSLPAGHLFAEAEIATQLIAKLSKRFKICL